VYRNWLGFFISTLLTAHGVDSAAKHAGWSPVIFNLLSMARCGGFSI
jgi:hypothetical protein